MRRIKIKSPLKAQPIHYGLYIGLWCALPPLALMIVSALPILGLPHFTYDLGVVSSFIWINLCVLAGLSWALWHMKPTFNARRALEKWLKFFLCLTSLTAILASLGIILSLLFEAICFFQLVSPMDFLFGAQWSPQLAKTMPSEAFGIIPLFSGTLLITGIALCIATPVGLMAAIYLAEFSSSKRRAILKPLLEMLAGVPTVVYGFLAVVMISPALQAVGDVFGMKISSESALGVGIVMGVMLIPLISSLSEDVIQAVPKALREAALGLGATQRESICHVVLPAALPGIVGGVLLAFSRAIGETMIVVMAAGLSAHLTGNPLNAVTTVTVQIVSLLTGDQEFNSSQTLAAFALGLVLFIVTLCLNTVALFVMRQFREKYD